VLNGKMIKYFRRLFVLKIKMGIKNLKKALAPIFKQKHITHFRGKRVAIDIFVYLHKGASLNSVDIAYGREANKHVHVCRKIIELMKANGIVCVFVFDGCSLPAKKATNDARREGRQEAKERAYHF
jgi:exonuclease-1